MQNFVEKYLNNKVETYEYAGQRAFNFIAGSNIPSKVLKMLEGHLSIEYIVIPYSFNNIHLSGSLNGVPFLIEGVYDLTTFLNIVNTVLLAILPTITFNYDPSTHLLSFVDVAPMTLILNDQQTMDTLGFELDTYNGLSITPENVINLKVNNFVFMDFSNELQVGSKIIYYDEITQREKSYNFVLDTSSQDLLTDIVSLSTKIDFSKNVYSYKATANNFQINFYDKYGNLMDFGNQKIFALFNIYK